MDASRRRYLIVTLALALAVMAVATARAILVTGPTAYYTAEMTVLGLVVGRRLALLT